MTSPSLNDYYLKFQLYIEFSLNIYRSSQDDQQKLKPKYFNCLYCDKKFAQRFHLINHEARIHAVNIPAQDHRSESDEEFSWDSKDQKNNSNSNLESQSAPMEDEVQDITEIEVDSPEIIESVEFTKENAQLLMNTFSQEYSKEEKTEIYDSYVTSPSITVSKKIYIIFSSNFF